MPNKSTVSETRRSSIRQSSKRWLHYLLSTILLKLLIIALLITVWLLWFYDIIIFKDEFSTIPAFMALTCYTGVIIWCFVSAIFNFFFVIHVWSYYSLIFGPGFFISCTVLILSGEDVLNSLLFFLLFVVSFSDGILSTTNRSPDPVIQFSKDSSKSESLEEPPALDPSRPLFFYIPLHGGIIIPLANYPEINKPLKGFNGDEIVVATTSKYSYELVSQISSIEVLSKASSSHYTLTSEVQNENDEQPDISGTEETKYNQNEFVFQIVATTSRGDSPELRNDEDTSPNKSDMKEDTSYNEDQNMFPSVAISTVDSHDELRNDQHTTSTNESVDVVSVEEDTSPKNPADESK